jgi:hypothetical protein
MNGKTKIVVGAATTALALGIGVGVAGMASADTAADPSPSSGAAADRSANGDGRGGHGHRGFGRHAAGLASKLGVDEAKVTEALEAFRAANKPADGTDPGRRPDRTARESALAASLAQSPGIGEAKVKAALEEIEAEERSERAAALKPRLDAAVKDGTLTQEEADGAAKAVEKGVIGGGR